MAKDNSGTSKKLSDEEAERLLLNYLNEQMRPYNINDLISNLHNAIPKTKCLVLLNKLTNDKKIHAKQFGKSNIWVCNDPREENNEKDVKIMVTKQEQIAAVKKEITTLIQKKQELEDYCTEYTDYIYDKDKLMARIKDLQTQTGDKKEKLANLEQDFVKMQKKYLQIKDNETALSSVESINIKIKQEGKKFKVLNNGYKNCIDLIKDIFSLKINDKLDNFLYDELGLERV